MPKASSPSKSSKKKKYNARFPPARIKKIMQTDEEVGKVAAAVPVIISRALEMFIESLVTETAKLTQAKNAKTLSTSHIKQTIKVTNQFDFLRDLVKNVPDHQADDNGDSAHDGEPSMKRGKGRRKKGEASVSGRKGKAGGGYKTSSDEDDDDDEEDDEDDEATETDEELTTGTVLCPTDNSSGQIGPALNSNLSHNHLQSSFSSMSHNNNYVSTEPGAQMSVLRDTLISGKNMAQVLHHQSLPLSLNCDPRSAPLCHDVKQPLYQMPSDFPPFISSNGSCLPVNSAYPINPVSQTLLQHQQQPIDLTNHLQQNCGNEDDDYDT